MRPGEGEGEGEGGGKAVGRIAAVRITVGLFPLEDIREPYTADRYRACRCSACRLVRMAAVRESVALTTVVCVARLLARVQLGEPRLGGLCLGRRAPASGHRPVRSPREWRRQAGAARAAGADVSTHTAGECGGALTVLTQRPCATARVSSGARGTPHELRLRSSAFSRSSRVHGLTGRRAGSAWPRLRTSSMNARIGGRRGHAVCRPRRDGARLKFGDRSTSRLSSSTGVWQQQQQPICRVTQAHIIRSTPGTITQRTSWLAQP